MNNTINGFQIRSEDKGVHMVPETTQGTEHLRKQSVCSASRNAAESSTLEEPSVDSYPASKLPALLPTNLGYQNIAFLLLFLLLLLLFFLSFLFFSFCI
jgi:hypothetical protein